MSELFPTTDAAPEPTPPRPMRRRRERSAGGLGGNSILARGEPMLWLTGGSLVICVVMIIGLLGLILYQGIITFWPIPVVRVETIDGRIYMGEVTRTDTYRLDPQNLATLDAESQTLAKAETERGNGLIVRRLIRTGNYELTNEHFNWINNYSIKADGETLPRWALVFERLSWGRFYGEPKALLIDGAAVATEAEEIWAQFQRYHPEVRERWKKRRDLETHEIGAVNREIEAARLALRDTELKFGTDSPEWRAQQEKHTAVEARTNAEFERIREEIEKLDGINDQYQIVVTTADGVEKSMGLAEIVRAYPANNIGLFDQIGIYISRTWEFLSDSPREANSEGGVFPAIFGTVIMTLLMSIAVVPFGVLAALYLREYAKAGPMVSAVRIAVNNLAGVPSIVFGVFGLGFFSYIIGGTIDQVFFSAKLPNPTFGTGGIMWASFTLALLTLPVVIVATEEALAAVPASMRAGSYACGASKWQTIWRIVLPRAMPGITTGMILAMARGAGEVAPLMLVGAVKLAPELPLDGVMPFIHPERSFMHLGFHIYDLGFQSQNSEAAQPMVFTTTLLLILIIAVLNLAAIWIRARLRRKFVGSQF